MDIAVKNIEPKKIDHVDNSLRNLKSNCPEQYKGTETLSSGIDEPFSTPIPEKSIRIAKEEDKIALQPAFIPSERSKASQSIIKTSQFNEIRTENDNILIMNSSRSMILADNLPNLTRSESLPQSIQDRLKNDRKGFIIKVYILLCFQLLITCFFTGVTLGVPQLKEGIKNTRPVLILVSILTLVLVISIMIYKKIARKVPFNYIALFVFTLFESYIVAYVCAFYDPLLVLLTVLIALSVAVSLFIYAFSSKTDFTVSGGILISFATSLIFFIVLMIFFNQFYMNLIICEIFILAYSAFIVYDTQLIAGGRYEEIRFDDYVIGSLILYFDIVGLFFYILSILFTKSS